MSSSQTDKLEYERRMLMSNVKDKLPQSISRKIGEMAATTLDEEKLNTFWKRTDSLGCEKYKFTELFNYKIEVDIPENADADPPPETDELRTALYVHFLSRDYKVWKNSFRKITPNNNVVIVYDPNLIHNDNKLNFVILRRYTRAIERQGLNVNYQVVAHSYIGLGLNYYDKSHKVAILQYRDPEYTILLCFLFAIMKKLYPTLDPYKVNIYLKDLLGTEMLYKTLPTGGKALLENPESKKYNGRMYKVRTGSKGGKYILVQKKKIYV
jgi:hypothetical protein